MFTILKRKKAIEKPVVADKDTCEIVILVGSEMGTCYEYANDLYKALKISGGKVFLTELNDYTAYSKAKQMIILTSTYGDGEAPTNARKFMEKFQSIDQPHPINYAVVGFGSLDYPDFCQFAVDVDELLQSKDGFKPLLPLYRIDESELSNFDKWTEMWSEQNKMNIGIESEVREKKALEMHSFEVIEKTALNVDDTFLLRLKPKKEVEFTSGDLVSIFPKGTETVRQYSIARIGEEILLSIKKLEFGRGSSYLFSLNEGDVIQAAVEHNLSFHFPANINDAILIANGTGIAPFLGMMNQNRDTNIKLLWGGRFKTSSGIYDSALEFDMMHNSKLKMEKCYSREPNKQYVQDLVLENSEAILKNFENGGIVMICGSLTMQHGVLDVLEEILKENSSQTLDVLMKNGQLMMDCY